MSERRYGIAIVLMDMDMPMPVTLESSVVYEADGVEDAKHTYQRLVAGATPKPKTTAAICGQLGPGEVRCELAVHRHDMAHSYRMVGEKGVLGTLYWEVDPDEGLLATWKPERGAFESAKEWKERQARYAANQQGEAAGG